MDLTEENIERCKDLVYSRSNLCFPPSRESHLRRWIRQLADEGGHQTFNAYFHALLADSREFDRLIALITTKETYFFRMPEQFQTLDALVLPEIVEREGKKAFASLSRKEPYRMRLRVWSAGCAMGQEAYSLSMQALETIRYPRAWDIKVLGTDINADTLETAKAGRYEAAKLGKMAPALIERYFAASGREEISAVQALRDVTEFQCLNLRDLPDMASFRNAFDIIFCRNVMIYFDLAAQQRLVSALSECLVPGGYLFTGEGEVLHLYNHSFRVRERGACIFYQKPEG
jgi:chemotaxis protein methyltransferase CheR